MKTEIEAKFLNVDHDAIRRTLKELGAELEQPMRMMRRALIRTDDMKRPERDAFIRVRDEGDKVTLTYKQFDEHSLSGAKEIEIIVSSFEDTLAILAQADLVHQSYQESKRETWRLGGAEIVLDEWPWLEPYIEIEADSEEIVKTTAAALGFSWGDAIFGSVTQAYQAQYPASTGNGVIDIAEVKFGAPLPTVFGGKS